MSGEVHKTHFSPLILPITFDFFEKCFTISYTLIIYCYFLKEPLGPRNSAENRESGSWGTNGIPSFHATLPISDVNEP